jgi:hypothetical protein
MDTLVSGYNKEFHGSHKKLPSHFIIDSNSDISYGIFLRKFGLRENFSLVYQLFKEK